MSTGKLTPLQHRILELLAGVTPPWTITGGAALAGFHLAHRSTRDLDLFWHGFRSLETVREECRRRLRRASLSVETMQREPAFERLLVSDGSDRVVLDLVAEPVSTVEPPTLMPLGGVSVLVDTPHEILVNKLCALLGRAELRDLVDVRALLDHGGDLDRALADAPRKDAGFSALTLAWVLKGMPISTLAAAGNPGTADRRTWEDRRDALVERLLRAARP